MQVSLVLFGEKEAIPTSNKWLILAHVEMPVVVQSLSHVQPMDYSTPGSSVLLYLPEFAQTHVHWVSDAIQP